MKYVIIIPEGAGDQPQADLGGKTPLEVANTPTFDWLANNGKNGTVKHLYKKNKNDCDISNKLVSALGYNPTQYETQLAPLKAAGCDINLDDEDWAFCCDLVTIINGTLEDHSAGHISSTESAQLITRLASTLEGTGISLYKGTSYQHLMVIPGDLGVKTTPPFEIIGKNIAANLPAGEGSQVITTLMDRAHQMLEVSDINAVREELGENLATDIWLWGQGQKCMLPNFEQTYKKTAALIAGSEAIRGVAKISGIYCPEITGSTGYINTSYAAKCDAALCALSTHDLVIVHVEAPKEASLAGDIKSKIDALEKIDQQIAIPILHDLVQSGKDWRMLIMPTCSCSSSEQKIIDQPIPFAIAGKRIKNLVPGDYTETQAANSDLHIEKPHAMMEYLLTVR